jgi:hypothetical protein
MGFDPDDAARASGEEHLIPPSVTPLTTAERFALVAYSERVLAGYTRLPLEGEFLHLESETDPVVLSRALKREAEPLSTFFSSFPNPDAHQRTLLWDKLTYMHTIIAKIELVVLGLDFESYKAEQNEKIQNRRVVQP